MENKLKENFIDKKTLIENNIDLVKSVARRYIGTGIEFDDLVQEGCIGLIRAADAFDPDRGSFSTCAVYWIKKTILQSLNHNSRIIRIPDNLSSKLSKFNKVKRYLTNVYGREPKIEEIAESLNISVEKAMHFELLQKTVILSMDTPLQDDDSDYSLKDTFAADDVFEDEVLDSVLSEEVLALLKKCNLSDKEIYILSLIYGLNGETPKSLTEVGNIFGIKKQAVHQKEGRILKKIRSCNDTAKFADCMDYPEAAKERLLVLRNKG